MIDEEVAGLGYQKMGDEYCLISRNTALVKALTSAEISEPNLRLPPGRSLKSGFSDHLRRVVCVRAPPPFSDPTSGGAVRSY